MNASSIAARRPLIFSVVAHSPMKDSHVVAARFTPRSSGLETVGFAILKRSPRSTVMVTSTLPDF